MHEQWGIERKGKTQARCVMFREELNLAGYPNTYTECPALFAQIQPSMLSRCSKCSFGNAMHYNITYVSLTKTLKMMFLL
jgi:hypothetical protein